MKRFYAAFAFLAAAITLAGIVPMPAISAPLYLNSLYGVCDPLVPAQCIAPNPDGSINTAAADGITRLASFLYINGAVAVCDPGNPSHCIVPNSDGSINVSGGGGSSPCSAFGATAGTCAQGNDVRFNQASGQNGTIQYNNGGVLGGTSLALTTDSLGDFVWTAISPSPITICNTSDCTTNFETATIGWISSVFTISTNKGGTGASRNIAITASNNLVLQTNWTFSSVNLSGSTAAGVRLIVNANATATVPNILWNRSCGTCGIGGTNTGMTLTSGMHFGFTGTAPAAGACGTSPGTPSGTDSAFTIVAGTVTSSCVVTFNAAYASAPICQAVDNTAFQDVHTTETTSQVTITATAALGGDTLKVMCVGN